MTTDAGVLRQPRIGDSVIIHAALCEWDGVQGTVTGISSDPMDSLPIMVERSDYYQWPFAIYELELVTLDEEVYENGWTA